MNELIEYIKNNFTNHTHLDITVRVLECLTYIEGNIDAISAKVGSKALLRHPQNHLAFHLSGYDNPQDAKRGLLDLVNEVRSSLSNIIAIQDVNERHQAMNFFMDNINDSKTGCMEARLRPALMGYALYLNIGCHDLGSHIAEFINQHPSAEVVDVIGFFGMRVQHNVMVKDEQGNPVSLTWELIMNYLAKVLYWDTIESDWEKAINSLAKPNIDFDGRWYTYHFKNETDAQVYLSYVKSLLPAMNAELMKAEVKIDRNSQIFTFRLSEAQRLAFNQTTILSLPKDKEELETENEKEVIYVDQLVKKLNVAMKEIDRNFVEINSSITTVALNRIRDKARKQAKKYDQQTDFVVKSLRVDENIYFRRFVEMIAQPHKKHRLRNGDKRPYTVTGRGVFKRRGSWGKEEPPNKVPQYRSEVKTGFSKAQSASLGMPNYFPPLFGFNSRGDKLVGVMINTNNTLFSDRLYIYDGGTIGRPYDFEKYQDACQYYINNSNRIIFESSQVEKFKSAIMQNDDAHNEALVRMRWGDDKTSKIIIGSNTRAACLWAQELARIMKNHLVSINLMSREDNIPIAYYLPDDPELHLKEYTQVEQLVETIEAYRDYLDPDISWNSYNLQCYEILFSVPPNEIADVFRKTCGNCNLILKMMLEGYTHVVVSLIERAGDEYREEILNILKSEFLKEENYSLIWSILLQCEITQNKLLLDLITECAPLEESLYFMISDHHKILLDQITYAIDNHLCNYLKLILRHAYSTVNQLCKQRHPYHYLRDMSLVVGITAGDIELVEASLKAEKQDLHKHPLFFTYESSYAVYSRLFTPLQFAAHKGQLEVVKALLSSPGVNESLKYSGRYSALVSAAAEGHLEIVKVLVEHKDIKPSRQAVRSAAKYGHIEVVNFLLSHPAVIQDESVMVLFRNPNTHPKVRIHLLTQPNFTAIFMKGSMTVTRFLEMSVDIHSAKYVLDYLRNKYLPDYIESLSARERDYANFYGKLFGVEKAKKLNAAQAILNGDDLTTHIAALSEGRLGVVYRLLTACENTLKNDNNKDNSPRHKRD